MSWENDMKINKEYSIKLSKSLNEKVNNNIKYYPTWSNDQIGVRQVLDKRELQYNEIFLKSEIIKEYSLEQIIEIVYYSLGIGNFKAVYPKEKTIELFDKLKDNDWDIYIDNGELFIDDGICIEDIISKEITKDLVKFEVDIEEYGYRYMIITKINNDINIEYLE